MNEKPIIFSGEMVRAILDGRKSQTRRVANVRGADRVLHVTDAMLVPRRSGDVGFTGWVAEVDKLGGEHGLHLPLICPYGQPGGQLWVREAWAMNDPPSGAIYRADGEAHNGFPSRWKPSIHMPRKFSRITLEITGIRVERIQAISEADCLSEGVKALEGQFAGCFVVADVPGAMSGTTAKECFERRWNLLNAKRGFGWDANPWVWVVEFRRRTA